MKYQLDIKKEFIDFHMFEIPALCEYFSEMAKKGWMLEKLRLHTATYRRCEPQEVTFFININERTSNLSYDYVSTQDQLFSDFVQEYGLQLVCRYSYYQVFSTNQTLDFSFYEDDVHHYLQSKRKIILRFERNFYVMFVVMYGFMALLWCLPSFPSINFSIYQKFIFAPIIFCFAYPNCFPLLKWLIKKEKYQSSIAEIKARSQLSICLYSLIFFPGMLCIFTGNFIGIFVFTLILTYTIIPFFLFRAIFIHRYRIVRWCLTLLCIATTTYLCIACLWIPFRSMDVIDVVAPYYPYDANAEVNSDFYIAFKNSTIFIDDYSFYEKRGVDDDCYHKNIERQSPNFDVNAYCSLDRNYNLYVIKNRLLQDSFISSILNERSLHFVDKTQTYRIYQDDRYTFIIKDNIILSVSEIDLDDAFIQELLIKFHM